MKLAVRDGAAVHYTTDSINSFAVQEWQKLDAEYVAQQFPTTTARKAMHRLAALL